MGKSVSVENELIVPYCGNKVVFLLIKREPSWKVRWKDSFFPTLKERLGISSTQCSMAKYILMSAFLQYFSFLVALLSLNPGGDM